MADFTTGNTSPNDGFKAGINSTSGFSIAELRQQEDAPIDIFTNTTFTRKMRIAHSSPFHPLGGDLPRVGIGTVDFPLAYLHIGLDKINPPNPNTNTMGFRTWMDKGVFMVGGPIPALPNIGTDNMYMGLKEVTTDRTDAIINWGNNPFNDPFNHGDRLLFVFTADPSSGFNAGTPDGLETARMISDGSISMTGIGGDPTVNPYSFPFAGPPAGSDPGNTVEINSPAPGSISATILNTTTGFNTPNPLGGRGFSGLRFTDLTSNSTPVPSANFTPTGVLSVDQNGDIILVPGPGASALACSSPASILSAGPGNDGRIGLNGNNFYFEGNASGLNNDNSVLIGVLCGTLPNAKLDVFQNSTSTGTRGINIENNDNSGGGTSSIGIKSYMSATGTVGPCGNIAGWFETVSTPPQTVPLSIVVPKGGGAVSIGFAPSTSANPNHCFTTTLNYILQIAGSGLASNGVWQNSDENLKTDIQPISNGLNKIRNLQGISFKWIPSFVGDSAMSGTQLGFMTQQVDSVIPEVVFTEINGSKLLKYDGIIPVAVEAIKQLDSTVTALQNAPSGISGTGTTNLITKWSGANTVTSSNVFDNGTYVGIGTNTPQQTLDVNGSLKVGSGANLPTLSNAYGVFTSLPGANAGFTINRGNNSSYASLDFVENGQPYTTGWSVQMQPGINNLAFLDRINNINVVTLHHGGNMDVVGNIYATGTITQNSDIFLKQNTDSISNALEIISQLNPRTFNFDTANYSYMNLPGGKQYGITAQEAENVLPEIVKQTFVPQMNDSAGNMVHPETHFKTVNYIALIPILLQGIKEQQSQINTLSALLAQCCSTTVKTTSNIPSSDAELESSGAILYQNIPNPFDGSTVIRYFIPENSIAVMKFYDEFGSEIKTVELPHTGTEAKLNLSTSNLASGIYSYSLVVNGKIAGTKKMLRVK